MLEGGRKGDNFGFLLMLRLRTETTLAFSTFQGRCSDLNSSQRLIQAAVMTNNALSHSFLIQMEISSQPCALLEFNDRKIFRIFSSGMVNRGRAIGSRS